MVVKLAEQGHTPVTHFAAARMISAAAISAAENGQLVGSVLKTFQELFQDTDADIRKSAIDDLARVLPKLPAGDAERLFFFEVPGTLPFL